VKRWHVEDRRRRPPVSFSVEFAVCSTAEEKDP
jgi:hypothetical protein